MKFIPILLVTSLLLTLVPFANAAEPTTADITWEVGFQLSETTITSVSSGQTNDYATTPQNYIIVFGSGGAAITLENSAGTDIFSVNGAGAITNIRAGSNPYFIHHTNISGSWYAAVGWAQTNTENVRAIWSPSVTIVINDLPNCILTSTNANKCYAYGMEHILVKVSATDVVGAIFSIPGILPETGIMSGCTNCPEVTKSPTTSQFTWSRVGVLNKFSDNSAPAGPGPFLWASSGISGLHDVRQSLASDVANGRFLDNIRFQMQSGNCNAGPTPIWISVGLTNNDTWDVTQELANFTGTVQSTTGGESTQFTDITVDFEGRTISSSQTNVASIVVNTMTPNPLLAPLFESTLYFRIAIVKVSACAGGSSQTTRQTSDTYTAGTSYNCETGTCVSSAFDLYRLSFFIHGGTSITYTLSATNKHVGGAYYVEICESKIDSDPQHYIMSSNFGGSAIPTGFNAAGTNICTGVLGTLQQTIQEWRVGYDNIPRNSSTSLTITLDATGSSRNLIYVGAFAGTQPAHPHIAGTYSFTSSGQGTFSTYVLLSSDDYFTQITITTKECIGSLSGTGVCTGTSTNLPNVTITTYLTGRTIVNTSNSNAISNISGQDLANDEFAIVLQKIGYFTQTYTVTVGYGQTNITLYMKKLVDGGSISTEFIICTPETQSVTVPEQANFSIQNAYEGTVFYSFFRIQTNGLPSFIGSIYEFNGLTGIILYPPGRPSNNATGQNDTGAYILAFSNEKGEPIKTCAFAINSGTTNYQIPTVDQTALSTIQATLQTPIAQAIITQRQANEETQTSNAILQAAIWWFSDGRWTFGIPHFVVVLLWVSIIALLLFLVMVTRRRDD